MGGGRGSISINEGVLLCFDVTPCPRPPLGIRESQFGPFLLIVHMKELSSKNALALSAKSARTPPVPHTIQHPYS